MLEGGGVGVGLSPGSTAPAPYRYHVLPLPNSSLPSFCETLYWKAPSSTTSASPVETALFASLKEPPSLAVSEVSTRLTFSLPKAFAAPLLATKSLCTPLTLPLTCSLSPSTSPPGASLTRRTKTPPFPVPALSLRLPIVSFLNGVEEFPGASYARLTVAPSRESFVRFESSVTFHTEFAPLSASVRLVP